MLGYRYASEVTGASIYGTVPEDFAMDEVYCYGDEDTLFDCNFEDTDNCGSDEGAGVICEV